MGQMGSQRATSGMSMEGEMKFKVGDKVRVRQWEAMSRGNKFVCDSISFPETPFLFPVAGKRFCGQVVTIKEIEGDYYHIEEDNGQYCWIDEMFEGYAFEYGEIVEFSDFGERWERKVYVGYIDGANYPYISADLADIAEFRESAGFDCVHWKRARPVQHTIIIDGIEIGVSDSAYRALKEKLCGGQK